MRRIGMVLTGIGVLAALLPAVAAGAAGCARANRWREHRGPPNWRDPRPRPCPQRLRQTVLQAVPLALDDLFDSELGVAQVRERHLSRAR